MFGTKDFIAPRAFASPLPEAEAPIPTEMEESHLKAK